MLRKGNLEKALKKLEKSCGADISAIVSRSGRPIAWNIPDEALVESFATLSATIMGASEVIYRGLNKEVPKKIIIESEGGTSIVTSIGPKMLLVALSTTHDKSFFTIVDETVENIKNLLKSEEEKI